jgi:hypothetical protein
MDFLHRHRLAHAPRRSLAELPEGEVARVVGRAGQLTEVLEAPISGRPCLYYKVTLGQPLFGLAIPHAHEERGVLFTLDDGTERAIIDPHDCVLDLVVDERDASGSNHPPTFQELALVWRHGLEANERFRDGGLGAKDFVYREAIIGVGEEIAILGSVVREPDPEASPYRDIQPPRLRMKGASMIISDHPSTTR